MATSFAFFHSLIFFKCGIVYKQTNNKICCRKIQTLTQTNRCCAKKMWIRGRDNGKIKREREQIKKNYESSMINVMSHSCWITWRWALDKTKKWSIHVQCHTTNAVVYTLATAKERKKNTSQIHFTILRSIFNSSIKMKFVCEMDFNGTWSI